MAVLMTQVAWIDRAASRLSRLDPQASIDDLHAIAKAGVQDSQGQWPETWADEYFLNRPSSLTTWWRRDFWTRILELEPRLSSVDLWDLMEGVWDQTPDRILTPRAMADYVMGVTLPPMDRSSERVIH